MKHSPAASSLRQSSSSSQVGAEATARAAMSSSGEPSNILRRHQSQTTVPDEHTRLLRRHNSNTLSRTVPITPHLYHQSLSSLSQNSYLRNKDNEESTHTSDSTEIVSNQAPRDRIDILEEQPLERPILRQTSSFNSTGSDKNTDKGKNGFILIIIYGLINTIMCVPCLYGYASVIFNHDVFQQDINALSKLVLFSSLVHMACFSISSSLPFSIGQVQDAGLIFLSAMANTIANAMLEDGKDRQAIVSTTIVLLGLATSTLGLILVLMGKFRLADLVSYLPLPVVGGYLAFIGYFCLEAGVALCINKSMMTIRDWSYLFEPRLLLLATPGILGGLLIMLLARYSTNDAALPMVMVGLPLAFYLAVFFIPDIGMERAREAGWLGQKSPPIPAQDVFGLIHFARVDWSLIKQILPTWAGMVFVVSFSSCLDVAAISMDMGEALDVNNELVTVGFSNFVSGLFCGFTGSYIFSQTIFTYRTGCRTRWIGIFLVFSELGVFLMTVNVLEVTPLFFLGATLIFIGFDLMYEWLWDVRHKLLMSEYVVLVMTFVAIHIVGIDGGILIGFIFAALDYVVTTAKATSLVRVSKRSRAVWNQEQWNLLQQHGYDSENPKIITLELKGSVFFGSSLQLLTSMSEEIGLHPTKFDREEMQSVMASPMHGRSPKPPRPTPKTYAASVRRRNDQNNKLQADCIVQQRASTPDFLVLDLQQMQNLDASAARGCFLQLAKMCGKRGVVVCAAGANPRVDWMLRSHDCSYEVGEEEESIKEKLLGSHSQTAALEINKMLVCETTDEALEFCELCLVERMIGTTVMTRPRSFINLAEDISSTASGLFSTYTLSAVFKQYLGLDEKETVLLEEFEKHGKPFHEEIKLKSGDLIFVDGEESDAFYIVLAGSVALHQKESSRGTAMDVRSRPLNQHLQSSEHRIVSGAGVLSHPMRKHSFAEKASQDVGRIKKYLQLGAIFGFVDFILNQSRTFGAVAKTDGSVVARIKREGLERLKAENPALQRIVEKVLLQASIRELADAV